MTNIVCPDNSFIQLSITPPADAACEDIFPSCLPVNSFDDLSIQFQVISPEDPPTVVIKLGGTTLDNLSSHKLSQVNIGGANHWLTVDTNCCDNTLALATLNQHFSGTGTWTIDPRSGDIICSGDIHAFATDLSGYGITYTIVCPCYLKITNFGDPAISITDLMTYLQDNYPSYGAWVNIDPVGTTHTDQIYAAGDVCSFDVTQLNTAMVALGHIGFTAEKDTSTIGCEMHITDFTCTDANVVDYLNQHFSSVGVWSIVAGKIVCTGDISAFAGSLPCITYTIDNDGTPQYTHLFYGLIKKGAHTIDEYVTDGDCFTITATVDATVFTSNCLRYMADDCYTTRIRYRSNENVFGFTYFIDDGSGGNILANFYNIVRLGFYLRHPVLKASEEVYRSSAGNYNLLSSIMENVWEGIVDMGNSDFHRRLFVALGNDEFWCLDGNNWKQYQKDGEYAVKWEKSGGYVIDSAPATFTVKEEPFHNFNSNCN